MKAIIRIIIGIALMFGVLSLKSILENITDIKWVVLSIQVLLFVALLIGLKILVKKYTQAANRLFEPRLIGKDIGIFGIWAVIFFGVYIVFTSASGCKNLTQWEKLVTFPVIANLMMVAFFEELFFRHYLFGAMLSSKVDVYLTVLISSVLFSIVHYRQYDYLVLIAIVLIGIVLSLLFLITRSLATPIALHFINNLFSKYHEQFGPLQPTTEETLKDICFFGVIAFVLAICAYRKKSFQNPMQLFNRIM